MQKYPILKTYALPALALFCFCFGLFAALPYINSNADFELYTEVNFLTLSSLAIYFLFRSNLLIFKIIEFAILILFLWGNLQIFKIG